MTLQLYKLAFDPTAPTAGQRVGSFILGLGEDVVTSTTAGGKEALDVNIAASDIDIQVDLDLAQVVADDAPDTENPLKIGYRATNAVLSALSATGDKANAISDMYRRNYINEAGNVGWKVTAVGVTNTAAELGATPQAGRKKMLIQNLSSVSVYVGPANTVTTANGFEIPKDSAFEFELGENLDIWAIAATAGPHNIRYLEIG